MRTTESIAVQRAHGIELIGEFEGSGFKVTPHLARRADGQVVQLTQLLYLVAEACDGRRDVEDHSTNVFWLALPSFGESWHHNHHAFPRSAVHGLKWWEVDTSAMVIRAMKRLHLAWNVVEITPERQAQKMAAKRSAVAA